MRGLQRPQPGTSRGTYVTSVSEKDYQFQSHSVSG